MQTMQTYDMRRFPRMDEVVLYNEMAFIRRLAGA